MSSESDHDEHFAHIPAAIREAHRHSSNHRAEILASGHCGCFCCCQVFQPTEIEEWVDERETAICPRCGIDSVIGERSGFPITAEFLNEMNTHWF